MFRVCTNYFSLAFIFGLGACASTSGVPHSGFFPEEFDKNVWINMKRYNEPKLHSEKERDRYEARHRFSISGVACREFVIRLDVLKGGGGRGKIKTRDRCKDRLSIDEKRFVVNSKEVEQLQTLIADAGLYEFYPEVWEYSNNEDTICIDGMQILLERRDDTGYGVSMANAQCTAPSEVIAIAQKFIDMAGDKRANRLLQ